MSSMPDDQLRLNAVDKVHTRKRVRELLDQKLSASAAVLAHFLVSSSSSCRDQDRCLLGEALFQEGEYHRAIHHLTRASFAQDFDTKSASKSESRAAKDPESELPPWKVRAKITLFLCHKALSNFPKACEAIAGVPLEALPVHIVMQVARLHELNNHRTEAVRLYYHVLKVQPLAVEASRRLISMGVDARAASVHDFPTELTSVRGPPAKKAKGVRTPRGTRTRRQGSKADFAPEEQKESAEDAKMAHKSPCKWHWLVQLIECWQMIRTGRLKSALDVLKRLDELYFDNVVVMLLISYVEAQYCNIEVTIRTLLRVRKIDPYNRAEMDVLAIHWFEQRGNSALLNQLTHDMMLVNQAKPTPEAYVVAAMYVMDVAETKASPAQPPEEGCKKALVYLEKALELDPDHAGALTAKGTVHLIENNYSMAVVCFVRAYRLDRMRIVAYTGLTNAYIYSNRMKQALLVAKDAHSLMPNNPRALSLVGTVLSHTPEGRVNARKVFNKALAIDPEHLPAVRGLLALFALERKFDDQLALLHTQPQTEYILTKMGEAYQSKGQLHNATSCFHQALGINSKYYPALKGMESVENAAGKQGDEEVQASEADEDDDEPNLSALRANLEAEMEEEDEDASEEELDLAQAAADMREVYLDDFDPE